MEGGTGAIIEIPRSSGYPVGGGREGGRGRGENERKIRFAIAERGEGASACAARRHGNKKPPRLFAIDFGQVRIGGRTHGAAASPTRSAPRS